MEVMECDYVEFVGVENTQLLKIKSDCHSETFCNIFVLSCKSLKYRISQIVNTNDSLLPLKMLFKGTRRSHSIRK